MQLSKTKPQPFTKAMVGKARNKNKKTSFDANGGMSGVTDVATGAGDTVTEFDGA